MGKRGERKQVLDGKKVQNVLWGERDNEHMWNGCNEMRKRERTERGEILNKDGRGIRKESPEDK
jgi:hypothetical protein